MWSRIRSRSCYNDVIHQEIVTSQYDCIHGLQRYTTSNFVQVNLIGLSNLLLIFIPSVDLLPSIYEASRLRIATDACQHPTPQILTNQPRFCKLCLQSIVSVCRRQKSAEAFENSEAKVFKLLPSTTE